MAIILGPYSTPGAEATVPVTEQNAQFCFDLCNRGYVLRRGQVVTAGKMEKLSTSPTAP